jgi:hypothetical protein
MNNASQSWVDALGASLTATLIAAGPSLGHLSLVVIGAWIGCMHAVANVDFDGSKKKALLYMIRWIATACLFTGVVTAGIVTYVGFPIDRWPGVVAFAITFFADRWPAWLESMLPSWLSGLIVKKD